MKSKQIGRNRESSSDFARLLEADLQNIQSLKPGDALEARIHNVREKDFVLVKTDTGSGVIDRGELLDNEGVITVAEGERIPVFYTGLTNGEKTFTTVPKGPARHAILEHSLENSLPLMGRIARQNKGGYEIELGDVMAFCPASQMEEDPSGLRYFIVTELSGKKVVASNRAYRSRLREKQKSVLMEELKEGDIVTGNIANVQDFGAFVDLGGFEGLIPASEIAFERVKPSQVLKSGESVRVKVLAIDWKEDRITLSRRALLDNPWQGQLPFREGEIVEGTIESIKPFGVFVKLTENFTGLIPASESGVPRGQRLEDTFTRGSTVRVLVARIERDRERISLSASKVSEMDSRKEYEKYMNENEEKSEGGISSFGKQLLQSLNKEDE